MTLAEWTAADTRAVAMVLNGDVLRPLDLDLAPLGAASAMVIANGSATPVDMTIARPPGGGQWASWSTPPATNRSTPAARLEEGAVVTLAPFAMMVLLRPGTSPVEGKS